MEEKQELVELDKMFIANKKDEPLQEHNQLLQAMQAQAMSKVVQEDEETRKMLLDSAKETVKNEFKGMEQKSLVKKQEATYDANSEACRNYGIDKAVPLWQIKIMKIGSAFWFMIYFIVATFTVAPIMVFFKGIKSFIKQTWLAVIFAIITYLIFAVVIPLLSVYVFPKIPKK